MAAVFLAVFLFFACCGTIYFGILLLQVRQNERRLEEQWAQEVREAKTLAASLAQQLQVLQKENARLSRWTVVADADAKAAELLSAAQARVNEADAEAALLLEDAQLQAQAAAAEAKQAAKDSLAEAQNLLDYATNQAAEIVDAAEKKAVDIAGSAYDAAQNAWAYEQVAAAMKNTIDGYGDRYLAPAHSLLDDLAEEFSHHQAGQQLKHARLLTKVMVENNTAAQCDYAEAVRKEMAERFVLDAFNGKVESILSRVKHDNAGTLEQEIRDAYTLVNHNGRAFRNARITEGYLAARLHELKWAAAAHVLKVQEREEQRAIRERIREEEKARREFEKAIREAAREERLIRDAMAKAQQQIEHATAAQRAEFELQLQELTEKLAQAEEKNQRALSMAQQTRRGHVYIISNVGSFGEHVYKIGLTRRLEPLDRIKELGDSSVPFEFDVHALIFSEDAPALENQLHKHFVMGQVNKVNHRKEFFRIDLQEIREEIEALGISAHWTMAAQAQEYRESLAIEEAITSSDEAKEAWLNRQLTLDPVGDEGEPLAEAAMA